MEKKLSDVIRTHSQQHGVDPLLVKAIISVESGWNPSARSSSGAKGLMQLMPETAAHLGVSDPFDPVQNIRGGVKYLGQMLREFGHLAWPERVTQALASYNAGLGAIREVGDYRKIPKTRRYIDKVMKAYEEIRNRKDSEFAYLGREPSS
jgi:soluble lytic murein transglycosylase-like protein